MKNNTSRIRITSNVKLMRIVIGICLKRYSWTIITMLNRRNKSGSYMLHSMVKSITLRKERLIKSIIIITF